MNRLAAVTATSLLLLGVPFGVVLGGSKSFAQGATAEAASKPLEGFPQPMVLPLDPAEKLSPQVLALRDAIQVKWYNPQGVPDHEKQVVNISFAGKTKPSTRLYLKTNEVKVLNTPTEGNVRRLKNDEVKFLPSVTDRRGVFSFEVILPPGNYQLPVSAVDPDAQFANAVKTYVLVLNVTMDGIGFEFVEEGRELPFVPQSDYYSLSLGLNYTVFNKEVPSIPSEVRFSSFKVPSVRLGYAKTVHPLWRLHASLSVAPGETAAGARIPVAKGTYLWTILSVDGIYSRDPWKFQWGSIKGRYAARAGLQAHSLPFLRSSSSADNTQTIENVSYLTPVIGGHVDLMTNYGLSYEAYMRVGIPLTYSDLELSSSRSFDGSIGARYQPKDSKWSYGVFWYGQWLSSKFSERDKFIGADVSGSSDILNSNLEFRLHYHMP